MTHHQALLAGYAAAMFGWLVARRVLPTMWPAPALVEFGRPWCEFSWAVGAALGVLAMGQLYVHDWLLPRSGARLLFDTVNQVLIYAPMIVLLAARRHPLTSAWLPSQRVPARLAVGLTLALAALAAFTLMRSTIADWPDLVAFVYRPSHLRFAVHVFLEDMTIAILFVRLAAASRRPRVVAIVVAALFAGGHVPGALAGGATLVDLVPLLLDFALTVGVLLVVSRAADIWWFWCVHFVLDMTQYAAMGR